MTDIPLYPLYNRTYHLYRLSPLHHGRTPLLDQRALRTHATRLKSQLKGDNLRGVEVNAANTDTTITQYGPLEECNWNLFGDEDAWIDHHQQLFDPNASQLSSVPAPEHARGVQVNLTYEAQTYNALLLRDSVSDPSPEGFTSLPLLLIRMPAPIRDLFLNYLKTNFDTHVSPLRLPTAFLTSTLESYFRRLTATTSQSIRDVIQQLHVQLAFPNSTTSLKHVDITIASADVSGFVSRGKRLRDTRSAPFTAAMSSYLQKHMAISLSNPKVCISKISCGAFTLSIDRMKLVPPEVLSDASLSEENDVEVSASQLAVQDFYSALVREAGGNSRFLPETLVPERTSSTPSSIGSASASRGRRKRAVSTTAANNANSKRSRARGKENGGSAEHDEDVDMSST